MTITAAPAVPNPNSATFAADAYPFTQWMAALGPEIDAETARINTLGYGAYSATSATSLTVGTGSKSLTIEAGKSFAVGQPVVIASTASPTNYMTGQVTSHNSLTGAMVVNATATGGSGTVAAWTISVASIVAGGGVSPDSIVVLTSGTSWTCPAGVTKVKYRMVGGGGGAGRVSASNPGGGGSAAGYCEGLSTVVPATGYVYSIGGAGTAATVDGTAGVAGGSTSMFGATASGGLGGLTSSYVVGGAASGGDINIQGMAGAFSSAGTGQQAEGGGTLFGAGGSPGSVAAKGYGAGGAGQNSTGGAGSPGVIILELYK